MTQNSNKPPYNKEELDRARLNLETGRITFAELARFFAAGKLVFVEPGNDLVETALIMQNDDVNSFAKLASAGKVCLVSDEQARQWDDEKTVLWAIVIKPWVLVQAGQ